MRCTPPRTGIVAINIINNKYNTYLANMQNLKFISFNGQLITYFESEANVMFSDAKHGLFIHINNLFDECRNCSHGHSEHSEIDCKDCGTYANLMNMRQKIEDLDRMRQSDIAKLTNAEIAAYHREHSSFETMTHFKINYLRLFKALHSEQKAAPILISRKSKNKRGV